MRSPVPRLRVFRAAPTRAVVLVLHGGQEQSRRRAHRLRPAYLRMLPFALDLHRAGRRQGVAVWLLCNRYRGWNRPDLDPVADARWALAGIRLAHPGVPIALVGHSMGGRVALRVADEPDVVAVCALAPWTTEKDHVDQLAGKAVLIVHGASDQVTKPADSLAYAERARVAGVDVRRLELPDEGHSMLRRARVWTLLVRRFVLGALDPG
ncbi:MAG TPA: alpha/beta fold hydrolase [Actinophytocola sp.]|uniref:alpha/beta hydrolase family protein n=1 Tax=Actinophytocola sp. TaxID=1872138 RepID=UPI002DBC83FA|nr:alpha/beta fold hydrolase [Actinophytocola sp.]HEU5470374.1 alpha/beta fold hydrolase [Actinophytocola sp.]